MTHIVWEFRPKTDKISEFEHHYGSAGTWAKLFRKSPKYGGTVLTKDLADENRYLLTDIWETEAAFDEFKKEHLAEYETLDKECEALTVSEVKIGVFEKVD